MPNTHEENPQNVMEQNSPTPQAPCPKKQTWLTALPLIVSLAAIAMACYTLQLSLIAQQEKAQALLQLDKIKQTQAITQEQVNASTQTIQHTQTQLTKQMDALEQHVETTLKQDRAQGQDWLLLKARYCLELAQINTHWSDNFSASIALLQQADEFLKPLNDSRLLEVRQAIAKEISLIKFIPTLDTAGLLGQFNALQIRLNQLLINTTANKASAEISTEKTTSPLPKTWRSHWEDSIHSLEKLVVIRRNDEEIKPLLSPLFEAMLRESIRLNLQAAQWALLNKNHAVYQLAIEQAVLGIQRGFKTEDPVGMAFIKQLKDLQLIQFTQSESLNAQALPLLNQVIDKSGSQDKPLGGEQKGVNKS